MIASCFARFLMVLLVIGQAGLATAQIEGVTPPAAKRMHGVDTLAASSSGEWLPFAGALNNGCNGQAGAMLRLQDGRIAVGGSFSACGSAASNNIAIYSPIADSWESVGEGVAGGYSRVTEIVESGPGFFVSGTFTDASGAPASNVAYWNGQEWFGLGEGLATEPYDLAYFDGVLYAAGHRMNGAQEPNIVLKKWNGSNWENVGTPDVQGKHSIRSLVEFNGALYAGGYFDSFAGVSANSIVKLQAGAWSVVGQAPGQGVLTSSDGLGVIEEMSASGSRLCATGVFATAGNALARNLACWNGSFWSALGGGLLSTDVLFATLTTDDTFHAGGNRVPAAGNTGPSNVSSWNGSAWSNLLYVSATDVLTLAHGMDGLYVGGRMHWVPDMYVNHMARLSATGWQRLGNLDGHGVARVNDVAMFRGEMYIAGEFRYAGSLRTSGIARWDGGAWQVVGSVQAHGLDGIGRTLHSTNDALYVGGSFLSAGGTPAPNIARWDGHAWTGLGPGPGGSVSAIQIHDGLLYAASSVRSGGIGEFNLVKRWDGEQWSIAGAGFAIVNRAPGYASAVSRFAVHEGDLYAGGRFNKVGYGDTPDAWNIARWNGSTWVKLGTEQSGVNDVVYALASGPDGLYVGGELTAAGPLNASGFPIEGTVAASRLARWDGSQWNSIGSGISDSTNRGYVADISFSGGRAYVGGYFSGAGGISANNIAEWDGLRWRALGRGVNSAVFSLVGINESDLYVAGVFGRAGPGVSVGVARWNSGVDIGFADGFEGDLALAERAGLD